MRTSPSIAPGADRPIHLVLDHFQNGSVWRETDEDGTDLETLLRQLMEGQYSNPVRIVRQLKLPMH